MPGTMTKSENGGRVGKKRPRQDKGKKTSNNKKDGFHKKKQKRPKQVESIVFDAEARTRYLQGFSQRKQQRRAFGLAMQKVKDRKAKLEQRAELKTAELEQIAEAEERKQNLLEEMAESVATPFRQNDDGDEEHSKGGEDAASETDVVLTYEDEQTQQQWGGQVIVTTSTHIPGAEEEVDTNNSRRRCSKNKKMRHHDVEQEYAGNVEHFLKDLKGHMPAKKKKQEHNKRRGGKHGASNMKGLGSAADLKTAQKVLARTAFKGKGAAASGGKKRKR